VLGAVAVRGDRLYFGSRDGYLYCVSTDGKPVAKFATHASLIASPAVTNRHVFCVAESGMIYCLDRQTLDLVWEFRLGTMPLFISSPAVARGHVYVGTQFDGLLCVGRPGEPGEQSAENQPLWPGRLGGPGRGGNSDDSPLARLGAFQWQYPTDQMGETDAAMVAAPIAVAGDDLLVPLAGREGRRGVACLPAELTDVDTPKTRWVYKTANLVVRSPAVCGDAVFLIDGEPGQSGRALHAVDRDTGQRRWKTAVGTDAAGTLCCTRDALFVEDEPGELSRFDFDGNKQWTAAVGPTERAPAVSEQFVVSAGVKPPGLVLLDRPTGRVLWRVSLGGRPTTAPLVIEDRVLVGTEAAIEGRSLVDGRPLADWQAGAADVPGVASDLVLDGDAVLFVSTGGKLVGIAHDDGAGRFQIDGARPGVAPLVSRGTVLYVGAESLMSFTPGEHDAKPSAWADVSWLGRPVTPMVLSRSNVYLGMAGWGLVHFGASP
jgi:outer membrane protein assembly factor BamB